VAGNLEVFFSFPLDGLTMRIIDMFGSESTKIIWVGKMPMRM